MRDSASVELAPALVVVADASPINYLVLIEQIDVLPHLYPTGIVVPPTVFAELTHRAGPRATHAWASNHPAWLTVVAPKNAIVAPRLDAGESEAIALAIEIRAAAVLMDDRAGCKEAMARLLDTSFRISAAVQDVLIR